MQDPHDLEKLLERQISFVRTADAKLALIVPSLIAMMGVALTLPLISSATLSSMVLTVALFIVASTIFGFILLAGLPQVEMGASTPLHFSSASKLTLEEYKEAISSMSVEVYTSELMEQCHINSRIASSRFRSVRTSFFGMCVFVPIWLALIASISFDL